MRVLGQLVRREIDHFGSRGFTHMRAARGNVHVAAADLDGVIGGHTAGSPQRLIVLHGRVRVSTRDESADLAAEDAVDWDEGEWHETRSPEPSSLLLVEGSSNEAASASDAWDAARRRQDGDSSSAM